MTAARPDTWMPLYWGDYLRDTLHLSAAEHGAYLLLIGHYWTTGKPLPDDNKRLSRIARMDAREWRAARPILEPFFTVEDGLWRHGRVDAELSQAVEHMEKRRAQTAAATEARKRRNEQRDDASNDDRNVDRNDDTRACVSPSPSPSNSDATASASPPPQDLKTHLFNGCLDWLAKQSGKPSDKLRPQMGRWIKQHGEGPVLDAITKAQTTAAVDPVAYVNGCLGGAKRDWSKYDVSPE